MSHLSRKKPEKHFFKNWVGENFFEIFFGFSRSLLIMMRRLSYRLSYSVVWESQKFSIIRKKLVFKKLLAFGLHLLNYMM